MTNHVHLIVDPGKMPVNLSLFMKRVAGRYTRYRNVALNRSGTAWNGRFRSNPIQTDKYLLTCCHYVEMNPVRAGMVTDPADYQWSSFRCRTGSEHLSWLDEDPCYRELGTSSLERQRIYKAMFETPFPVSKFEWIRKMVKTGSLIAEEDFTKWMEERLGRRLNPHSQGRPKRECWRRRK